MIAKLMTHPTIAELDVHIEHGHDTVHHSLASIVEKAETGISYEPEVLSPDQLLDDLLVVIIDSTLPWGLEPTLITADAMMDCHASRADDPDLLICVGKQSLYQSRVCVGY